MSNGNVKSGGILDNDLYKFTMKQLIDDIQPEATASYKFYCRTPVEFNAEFVDRLNQIINNYCLQTILMPDECTESLKRLCPYFSDGFIDKIINCNLLSPDSVKCSLDGSKLDITIDGLWSDVILWEVPLMAIISELYFDLIDTNWTNDVTSIFNIAREKAIKLDNAGCKFADFGTRRRRSFDTHNIVLDALTSIDSDRFIGTSNLALAMMRNIKPVGTMAHEFIMGVSGIYNDVRHANKIAMDLWNVYYDDNLSIMLTDTFTTDLFLKDFDFHIANKYSGVRQDSGDPFKFATKIIDHYTNLDIDPSTKTIVFSDGLSPRSAINIHEIFNDKINCVFGIGTNFTNDFKGSKPLNMVIKLDKINDINVCKIGDGHGKETGDKETIKLVKSIIKGDTNGQ